MWLEGIIAQSDFVRIINRFLPVKVHLQDEGDAEDQQERWLLLHPATQVALVPEEGLRVTCPAELQWHIAGLNPRVKLDALRVLVRPEVVEKHRGCALELDVTVEEADLHGLPQFIDAPIVKAVNAALARKKPEWRITETLSRTVGFGKHLDPVEALQIHAPQAKVRVTADAVVLAVAFDLDFVRDD